MSRRLTLTLFPITAALLIGACSPSATPPASSSAPEASSGPAATATPVPAGSAAESMPAEATSAAVPVDPCQLVTADEASALASATFGAGTAGSTSGGALTCTYGGQTTSVVQVIVAQASDATTAQADWAQEQAQAQAALTKAAPAGVNLTFNLSDTAVTGADRAAVASAKVTVGGVTVGVSAIYVLKGATFFTFSDLAVGHDAASASALEAQALTSLARIP
jgi:hypothetical protein